jgi:hypothetical protein
MNSGFCMWKCGHCLEWKDVRPVVESVGQMDCDREFTEQRLHKSITMLISNKGLQETRLSTAFQKSRPAFLGRPSFARGERSSQRNKEYATFPTERSSQPTKGVFGPPYGFSRKADQKRGFKGLPSPLSKGGR